jgi:hypothetical protein
LGLHFLAGDELVSIIPPVSTRAGLQTADDPPSTRLSAALIVRTCGAFIAAFALACGVLFSLRPFPDVPGIGQKYHYFKHHKDRYDVLFVGSSRFYHQIIPKQFDARVKELGKEDIRSFNFGYDGMWPPESYFVVRQILALKPRSLRWVVIDLMDVNANLDVRNNSTERMAYWHDPEHTLLAWRHLYYESAHQKDERVRLILAHARHLVGQLANIGAGARAIQDLLSPTRPWKQPKEWAGTEGFDPGPDTPMVGKELAGYHETVARLRQDLPPREVGPELRAGMADLIRDIRLAGAEPIFVIAPTLNSRENFTNLPEGAALFAFNNPNDFPALFDPAMHYDGWHLNERGARTFTDLLAERFSKQVLDDSSSQRPAPATHASADGSSR